MHFRQQDSCNQLRSRIGVCGKDGEENLKDYEHRDEPVALPEPGGYISNANSAPNQNGQEDFER